MSEPGLCPDPQLSDGAFLKGAFDEVVARSGKAAADVVRLGLTNRHVRYAGSDFYPPAWVLRCERAMLRVESVVAKLEAPP